MGKKTNVQKGKKGFQKTNPQAVSPQGQQRGFFSRLFNRNSTETRLYPDQGTTVDDNWNVPSLQFNQMQETISAKTTSTPNTYTPHLPGDTSDKYRFGPHAVAHAEIDTKRQEILGSLAASENYDAPGENGKRQQVSLNFNPSKARPLINSLAHSVLEESGYFDRGSSTYRGVNNVYSQETIRCAERIYKAEGKESFSDRRHAKESTAIFPCETSRTSDSVSYKYYIHPDVSTLVHGVEKDQKGHAKLQAEISEHQGKAAARNARNSNPFDLSDW